MAQTWSEFKQRVNLLLEGEAGRIGVENSVLIRMKAGLRELQRLIPELVPVRVMSFGSEDVYKWGEGSTGCFRSKQPIERIVLVKTGTGSFVSEIPLLTTGHFRSLMSGQEIGLIYQPSDGTFFVHPSVEHGNELQFFYRECFCDFSDTDEVPYGDLEENAVAEYVRSNLERVINRDPGLAREAERSMLQWRNRLFAEFARMRRTTGRMFGYSSPVGASETADGVNQIDHDKAVEFAAVGDFGEYHGNSIAVSNLISWMKPDFFLALGDCNYPSGETVTLETTIRKLYSRYIPNYCFPVWGNHDLMSASDRVYGKPLMDLFGTRISGINSGKFYYHFTRGPVQIFVLNSGYTDGDPRELDDIFYGGVQGNWLKESLAESTAIWKIVVMHRPPYTSESTYTPGIPSMRWPFRAWGADLVISGHGHNYERLLVDGLPYIVAGTGGAALRGFGTPVSGSLVRLQKFGALRVTATKYNLQTAFYDSDKKIQDILTLNVDKVADDVCGRNPVELDPGSTSGGGIITVDPNTGIVTITPVIPPGGVGDGGDGSDNPATDPVSPNDPVDPPEDIITPYDTGIKLAMPIITPEDGSEVAGFPTLVTLDHELENVGIYYTLDGSTPSAATSTLYTGPVSVDTGETIKAIAVKTNYSDSDVAEATYSASSVFTSFTFHGDTGSDTVGRWSKFDPDGTTDHEWRLGLSVSTSLAIKSIAIYQTDSTGVWDSGQAWATVAALYPNTDTPWPNHTDTDVQTVYSLKAYDGVTALNTGFGTPLTTLTSGTYTIKLFGQPYTAASGFFRCVITLADDSKIKLMTSAS